MSGASLKKGSGTFSGKMPDRVGEAGPGAVLSLAALLRRAGEKPSGRRPPRNEPEDDAPGPGQRCGDALPAASVLVARLRTEGIASWSDVTGWLLERPRFDFTGRAFDQATIQTLPVGPGVYRFFDAAGKLLYVGQSRTLHRRVSSYFRPGVDPGSRTGRIAARAHRLEVLPEGSDLAAQVREASEIRRRKPQVNTQRAVHERAVLPWRGCRVVILPAGRGQSREVFFVRDGEILDRRRMTAETASSHRRGPLLGRARTLVKRYFFTSDIQPGLPDVPQPRLKLPRRISRRSAEEAAQLLATWARRHADRVLSFDPTDAAGPDDAVRLLMAYLEADPAAGPVFIR